MKRERPPGEIVTFYSYKGGCGRSMALANVACLLAESTDHPILMIDWDLEAPGLHRFAAGLRSSQSVSGVADDQNARPGLLELFEELEDATRTLSQDRHDSTEKVLDAIDLERFLVPLDVSGVYFMKAGRFDDTYGDRMGTFPWEDLYRRQPALMRKFADALASRFRYVLIDSRTGLTDTAGICSTLMPEKLVVCFTPNRQSLIGAVERVRRATAFRRESEDVRPLTVFPLPSRVDLSEEALKKRWRFGPLDDGLPGYQPMFERLFEEVYDLSQCDLTGYFDAVQIQHAAAYAYGEELPVVVETSMDRLSLAKSYREFCNRLVEPVPWAASMSRGPDRHSDRLARVRDTARQRMVLADLQEEHASLAESIAKLEDQLSTEIETTNQLRQEREQYEYALEVMARRARRGVRLHEHHIVYMIGGTDADDIVTETYHTSALSDEAPILWHHLSVGLTNQESRIRSFRDLSQVSVFEVLPNPPPAIKPLEYLSAGMRENRLGVLIFFDPEIGTRAREWRLTYRWPGMWNPLRYRGRDVSILRLGDSYLVKRELMSVTFVFPSDAVRPRVRMLGGEPIEPIWRADLTGRPTVIYDIRTPAARDTYEWALEVDGFNQSH